MSINSIFQYEQVQPGLCPNCHAHSNFLTERVEFLWPHAIPSAAMSQAVIDAWGSIWLKQALAACRHCSKTMLLHQLVRWTEGDWEPVGGIRQVWPTRRPRELHAAAPAKVRDLFAEGARAEAAAAYRAAGAMYRAAVEELCRDRAAEGRDLFKKIEDLASRGVSPEVVADLHEARLLGNWSLHDGLEFSAEEVADVAELITEAVHVLYVQPEERRAMREARRARRDTFNAAT